MPDTIQIEQVARGLAKLVITGAIPTKVARKASTMAILFELACVYTPDPDARSDPPVRLVAAVKVAVDRIEEKDDSEGKKLSRALRYLFGLTASTQLMRARGRRAKAAGTFYDEGMSADTFLRRAQHDLLIPVAEELLAMDGEFRDRWPPDAKAS